MKLLQLNTYQWKAFVFAALLLVCLPRFNGNKSLVRTEPWDAKYFKAYVEYFRGEQPTAPIRPASNWRFLLPACASLLPFAANTSINILNFICLLGALYYLRKSMQFLCIPEEQIRFAQMLFVFSFPVFYYGCITYVDAGSVFFVSLGIYLFLSERYLLFFINFIIGLFAKETVALLIPFACLYALKQKKYGLFIGTLLLPLIYWIEFDLIRKYAPISEGEERIKFWEINTAAINHNLGRLRTWGAFVLTLGIPFILAIKKGWHLGFSHWLKPIPMACLAGFGTAVLLFFFSFISTVADGRIIWHSYFFLLLFIFDPESKPIFKRR